MCQGVGLHCRSVSESRTMAVRNRKVGAGHDLGTRHTWGVGALPGEA